MNNIEWKDGAVCFAHNMQYSDPMIPSITKAKDFQLNEIRKGDYIDGQELDTEQKYNDAVAVFELFNIQASAKDCGNWQVRKISYPQLMAIGKLKRLMDDTDKQVKVDGFLKAVSDDAAENARKIMPLFFCKPLASDVFSIEKLPSLDLSEKPKRRNKSKQAYDILKSLDYEYDLVKQKWFKKAYIND